MMRGVLSLTLLALLLGAPGQLSAQDEPAVDDDDSAAASPDRPVAAKATAELEATKPPEPGTEAAKSELPPEARRVMVKAWKAKEEHDFEAARVRFAEAAELGVDPATIAQELAWLALLERQVAQEDGRDEDAAAAADLARARLEEALAAGADIPSIASQLAYLALETGDLDAARVHLEQALDAGADPVTIALQLAYVLLELGEPEQARARFEQALDAGAEGASIQAGLAYIALQAGDLDEARVRFEQALEAGGDPKDLALPLAGVLTRLEMFDEASARIDQAEEAAADPAPVASTRGYLALARKALAARQGREEDVATHLALARGHFAEALALGADPADTALQLGYLAVEAKEFDHARTRFEEARLAGADQQTIALALAYLASQEGDYPAALDRFEQAQRGPQRELADQAAAEMAPTLLMLGRSHRKAERYDAAREAFGRAEELGADPQLVAMELAYLDADQGRLNDARVRLRQLKAGDDEALARQARAELRALPRLIWGDVYADFWAWHRFVPATSANLVPTLRLRGYLHPIAKLDLDFYVFFQISRDVASRANGPLGYPEIYADNTAMLGVGAQFRFWKKRVGLFAQAGPAFKLVDDGARRVAFDFRAGAFFGMEGSECRPEPQMGKPGARLDLHPCADVYADLIYVSRFNHNLLLFARGRFGLGYLVTGPVSWAPVVEGRILKDIHNDYYNNLVDVGLAHRWRLLKPFGLDFLFGIHAGTYFGLSNVDPAPSTLGYVELRWQLSTYVSF